MWPKAEKGFLRKQPERPLNGAAEEDQPPPLKWDRPSCLGCGYCPAACPLEALSFVNGLLRISPKCDLCLACFEVCPAGALKPAEKKRKSSFPLGGPA